MSVFPFNTVNDLAEFNMIAGRDEELIFYIYDSGSVAADLGGADCTWKLCPYGETVAVLTKTATLAVSPNNRMVVNLLPEDTASLSGKYIHQPIIVSASGSTFRPSQGIINIIGAIS